VSSGTLNLTIQYNRDIIRGGPKLYFLNADIFKSLSMISVNYKKQTNRQTDGQNCYIISRVSITVVTRDKNSRDNGSGTMALNVERNWTDRYGIVEFNVPLDTL